MSTPQKAAERAVQRVGAAAPIAWRHHARRAVLWCSRQFPDGFSTDQVFEALAAADVPPPPEPRAMGAVIRRVQREGRIAWGGEWRPSSRTINHGRPLRVWRRVWEFSLQQCRALHAQPCAECNHLEQFAADLRGGGCK